MKKLCVYSPGIGVLSETFVQRHMTILHPGQTVAMTTNMSKPAAGHWIPDIPILNFESTWKKFGRKVRNRLPTKLPIPLLDNGTAFLKKHKVTSFMGEYMDMSLTYIDLVKSLGIKFYVHAHGHDVSRELRRPEIREAYLRYNEIDGIITISEHSKQCLIDIGIRAELIHVIPSGVDIPAPRKPKPATEKISCLAVGRMVPIKAPILLLDSFRRAHEKCPNLHLEFVGGGEQMNPVLQYMEAFKLENAVTLHGPQSKEFVMDRLSKADIFLQHSFTDPTNGDTEGFPVAILEAMSYSLPIVSTIHAGIPEEIIHGESGLLAKEGDSEAMASFILQFAKDAEMRLRFGKNAYNRVKNNFTWDIEKQKLRTVMELD